MHTTCMHTHTHAHMCALAQHTKTHTHTYTHTDIQTRNYHAGLEKYNQMVSTGSFSEIGTFIPGLKVLLQLALQLNI